LPCNTESGQISPFLLPDPCSDAGVMHRSSIELVGSQLAELPGNPYCRNSNSTLSARCPLRPLVSCCCRRMRPRSAGLPPRRWARS
jgi:hypothetical protein